MTLITWSSELWLPRCSHAAPNELDAPRAGAVLDEADDRSGIAAWQPMAQNVGRTITTLGVYIHAVGAAGDIDARLESVDLATGDPGGLATANSNKVETISASGWKEFVLTAGHVVGEGEELSVIYAANDGTVNVTLGETRRGPNEGARKPYGDALIAPSEAWVKASLGEGAQQPAIGVKYDDGSWEFIPGVYPVVSVGSSTVATGGGPTEVGFEFQVPGAVTVSAIQLQLDPDGNGAFNLGTSSYVPGATDGRRLATIAFDKDVRYGDTTGMFFKRFPAVDLAANTTYYFTVEGTDGTGVTVRYMNVDSTALLGALGMPTDWKYVIDNESGGWASTPARMLVASLGISRIHDGAGGGAASVLGGGNLSGGFAA